MFIHDRNRKTIDLKGQVVLTLSQSINCPMVAAGDLPAEETQAFLITIQAADHSLATYIYLHLHKSNQCVIYAYDSAPFMGDRLEEVEGEGSDFVENMGFMMDNLNFNRLQPAEKERLVREIPLFYRDLKDFEPILSARRGVEAPSDEVLEEAVEADEFEPLQPSLLAPDAPPQPKQEVSEFFNVIDSNAESFSMPSHYFKDEKSKAGEKAFEEPSIPEPEPPALTQTIPALDVESAIEEQLDHLFEPGTLAAEEESYESLDLDMEEDDVVPPEKVSQPSPSIAETTQEPAADLDALEKMERSLAEDAKGSRVMRSPEPEVSRSVQKPPASPRRSLSPEEVKEILGILLSL